jgi:hypothetical protein
MQPLLVALIICLLFTITTPVIAQDTEQTCTPEQWQEHQEWFIEAISTLASSENPLNVLLLIDAGIDGVRAQCTGGQFSKVENPDGIFGPIVFGGTLYKVTFETLGGYGRLKPLVISGNCGLMFNVGFTTPVEGGAESELWQFDQCVAMFEVDTINAEDWHLSIERIN